MNYKDSEETYASNYQNHLNDRSYEEEIDIKCNVSNEYLQSIENLKYTFLINDIPDIYTRLKNYINQFKKNVSSVPIDELRIYDFIQLLMQWLINYIKEHQTDFDQALLYEFFHTFNIIIDTTKITHPFQLYEDDNLLQVLLEITDASNLNDEYTSHIMLEEIILFLILLIDETRECLKFIHHVYIKRQEVILVEPIHYTSYAKLIEKLSSYLPECIKNIEYIFDGTEDENAENTFLENFFMNVPILVSSNSEEAIQIGFQILYKLIDLDNKMIENLCENSEILSKSVLKLLDSEIDHKTLLFLIRSIGYMCFKDYNMQLYKLDSLIQFLDCDDERIVNYTSFAICNALKETNVQQFTEKDRLAILDKLCQIIQENSFNIISYVGESILGVFRVIPDYYYQDLVANGIFNTFQIIASVDTLMKMPTAEYFFNALKCLFGFADANDLSLFFAKEFVDSTLYSTLAELEFDEYDTTEVKEMIDSLLIEIDEKLKE